MASCDASVLPLDLLLDLLLDNGGFRLVDLRLDLHAGCCGLLRAVAVAPVQGSAWGDHSPIPGEAGVW